MINRLDLKGKEQGLTYVTKNCVTLTKELKNIKQTVNWPVKWIELSLAPRLSEGLLWCCVIDCFVIYEALHELR